MKRILALFLALMMALALFGCGKKSKANVLLSTAKNMEKQDSAAFEADVRVGMDLQGFSLPLTVSVTGETTRDPLMVHVHTDVSALLVNIDVDAYTQLRDQMVSSYVGVDFGFGSTWMRYSAPVKEMPTIPPTQILNIVSGLERNEDSPSDSGNPARFDGVISMKDLTQMTGPVSFKEVLEQSLSAFGQFAGLSKDIPDPDAGALIPLSIYIDEERMMVTEIRLDLSQLLQEMTADVSVVHFTELSVEIRFTGFGEIDRIEIPPEALGSEAGN